MGHKKPQYSFLQLGSKTKYPMSQDFTVRNKSLARLNPHFYCPSYLLPEDFAGRTARALVDESGVLSDSSHHGSPFSISHVGDEQ
jgi:hypothetical protein